MKKWSLRLTCASVIFAVAALILACSDTAVAGGKGKGKTNHAHIEAAYKEAKQLEQSLFKAGAKEAKQKVVEQGVIAELNAALRHVNAAMGHITRARNLNGNN